MTERKEVTGEGFRVKLSNKRKVRLLRSSSGGFNLEFHRRKSGGNPEYYSSTKSMESLYFNLSNDAMEALVEMYHMILNKERVDD